MKKQTTLPLQAHLLRGAFYLLLLLAVCMIPFALAKQNATKQSMAKLGNPLPIGVSHRMLTFEERVAYQRAIEDIYWRHRVWPKENLNSKPSLDAVISQEQLEKKVDDYLLNSQALEDFWQRPITREQLQAEMERMAHYTKQPEVLRELFAALGNDPFVIAECLARPVLTGRLVADLSAQAKGAHFGFVRPEELRTKPMTTMLGRAYTLPNISEGDAPCTEDTWTATSLAGAPDPRSFNTAVWTGSEMIIWGGAEGPGIYGDGRRYDPSTDSWTATSNSNAPDARAGHTAVWTGSEMIVWAGGVAPGLNTGGKYNPTADTWTATSTSNAPEGRYGQSAVWTGSEMIVWGGSAGGMTYFNTGGRYNPNTNTWSSTSTTNAPEARYYHTAVWNENGNEMIIWCGDNNGVSFNTGGRYNPSTNSWTATSTTNAPEGRSYGTTVWTGSEMIVWGGLHSNGDYLNTGGRYNPSTDSWTATSINNAPTARTSHTAVWTGSEMIVWAGFLRTIETTNTGGRYNPTTDSWTVTSTTNAPDGRYAAPDGRYLGVWTGNEMIVWGGLAQAGFAFNSGGRYCAQSGPTPTPTPTPTPCTGRCSPTPRPRPTPHPRPNTAAVGQIMPNGSRADYDRIQNNRERFVASENAG